MPSVLRQEILAASCVIDRKKMLIYGAPEVCFHEDHYRTCPAVLVRLETIECDRLP